jgi:ribosomal protein S18 acetylase RimI-like enzyme
MSITIAVTEDIPVLATLMNSAYRGESSKKGWTNEADLIQGELRTDAPTLAALMDKPGVTFLKYELEKGRITGCVCLEKQEKGLYLGMLTVSPLQQAVGIGSQLVAAAEQFAGENGYPCIIMSVISIRRELIAWYERRGYVKTGETIPFTPDQRFGIPTQPLEFAMMKKEITPTTV